MRLSYNWLQELVPDLTLSPEDLADLLTKKSFETVVSERWSIDEKVKTVRIEAIEPHPNADRLRLATVTDGSETIKVVCGAQNIQEGDIVPYAPPGATVIDKEGKPFKLSIATIRGVESPGMLASVRDLGIGEAHEGVFILPTHTPLKRTLNEFMPNDTILEADITPNRAHDCLSHLGVAREIAALLDVSVKEPETITLPEPSSEIAGIHIDTDGLDTSRVPRYMALVLEVQSQSQTPLWMQARLFACGARPISLSVDITNYVLFEIGNPSHAFDIKKLPGKTIGVRSAKAGERLMLLTEKEVEVPEGSLVISADQIPVALAGIMGGKIAEVDINTSQMVLEVANFHSYTIQQTAKTLGLRTEASIRFSKEIPLSFIDAAAARLAFLFKELSNAQLSGLLDTNSEKKPHHAIEFHPLSVSLIAGTNIEESIAESVLKRLRCTVEKQGDVWQVTPPLDRLDLLGEHDLIEEVIRVYGLENIMVDAEATYNPTALSSEIYWREVIRDTLRELGFSETYNYSWEPSKYSGLLSNTEAQSHIQLTNPMSPEQKNLRSSLLPGLLEHAVKNRDQFQKKIKRSEYALFEIGSVYVPAESDSRVPGVRERRMVAGVVVGGSISATDAVHKILAKLVISDIGKLDNAAHVGLDNNAVHYFTVHDEPAGVAGRITPEIQQKLKFRLPLEVFEIDLDELVMRAQDIEVPVRTIKEIQEEKATAAQYQQISQYPSVYRDISLVVSQNVHIDELQSTIERVGGELIVDVDLFDEYQPEGSEEKNIAFHIEYNSQEKTLTEQEVSRVHTQIEKAIQDEFDAQVK